MTVPVSALEKVLVTAAGTYPQDRIQVKILYNGQWFTGWLEATSYA